MSDDRVPVSRDRRSPGARFRCQVCAKFVVATDYGVCPRCGLGPPKVCADANGERDEVAWRAAKRDARGLVAGPTYWLTVALFAITIAFATAILVVC